MKVNVVCKGMSNLPESAKKIRRISKELLLVSNRKDGHLGDVLACLRMYQGELSDEIDKIRAYFEKEKAG